MLALSQVWEVGEKGEEVGSGQGCCVGRAEWSAEPWREEWEAGLSGRVWGLRSRAL